MIDDEKSFDLSGGIDKNEQKDVGGGEPEDKEKKEGVAPESSELQGVSDKKGSSEPQSTEGFTFILKQTFSVFFKNIWVFLGLAVLNIGIIGVLAILVMPALMLSLAGQGIFVVLAVAVVFALLQAMLSFVFYGAIANQAHSAYNDLSISVMDSVKTAFKLVGRGIYLGFKIFIYSGIWLVIVVMILAAVLTTVVGGGGGFLGFDGGDVIETAYAVDSNLVAQGGGLIGDVPDVHQPERLAGAVGGGSSKQLILMIGNLVLGLLAFIISILAMIRLVRASMAFPILFANPEATAKEALDESKRVTKDHWWLIVCFVAIFSFLLVVIPVLVQLLPLLAGSNGVINIVVMVVSLVAALLSFPLIITFYQVLAEELGNTARRLNLHVGLLIVAILIFLSPTLIAVAAPFILGNMLGGSGVATFGDSDFSYFDEVNIEGGEEDGLTGFSFGDEEDAEKDGDILGEESVNEDDFIRIKIINAFASDFDGGFAVLPDKSSSECLELPDDPSGGSFSYSTFEGPTCESGYYYESFTPDSHFLIGLNPESDFDGLQDSIDSYKDDNGSFPKDSGCLEDIEELGDYIDFEALILLDSPYTHYPGSCKGSYYYQYLGEDNYAFWAKMDDPSSGNADRTFAGLEELKAFVPLDEGEYYVSLIGSEAVAPLPDGEKTASESDGLEVLDDVPETKPVKVPRGVPRI